MENSEEFNPEPEALDFELPASQPQARLDKLLADLMPEHSRSRLQGWIDDGFVTVNGASVRRRHLVGPLDRIQVLIQPTPEALSSQPEDVAFVVVEASPHWIVVNKPAGLVVHPGAGNWSGTLLNGLLYRYPELAAVPRAGIVHRLDKDTSGLLVVARSDIAQTDLVRQLQSHSVARVYRALLKGMPAPAGTIDKAVGRDRRNPVCMSTEQPIAPKNAVTHYSVLQRGRWDSLPVSHAECRLETGRTHQIRVHMASLGHPLLGDALYQGPAWAGAERQMLHAFQLSFRDPVSGSECRFEAALPPDFQDCLQRIEWQNPL